MLIFLFPKQVLIAETAITQLRTEFQYSIKQILLFFNNAQPRSDFQKKLFPARVLFQARVLFPARILFQDCSIPITTRVPFTERFF